MSGDAERLARRVAGRPLPFTLGIYGAWGEGKTTLANLVSHYLGQQDGWRDRRFIEFSAWPYVTADAVWRALLETVARAVYKVPVDRDATRGPARSLPARLRSLLLGEVFPSSTEKSDEEQRGDDFERLMATFGRATAVASRAVSDAESARQLSTLAGLVVDIAAAVGSPLGPIRGLLGKGPDTAAKKTAERSVATVEEMRQGVRELFRAASHPRTVVLIDDLDRCLPEVAFDVLETIKIFLSESAEAEASCLFIVAVDQLVLYRGLSARVGGVNAIKQVDARMYLEKVIQMGIAVSAVRDSSSDRFIAAQFPEWVGAADLIDIATRGNPRRLKQQCDLLAFGFEREQAEKGGESA
nr:P-loop NTPase fold protein [Micromonospora terminaliae]